MRSAVPLLFAAISVMAQNPVPTPTDFEGLKQLGIERFYSTRYGEAIEAFERAAALKPNDANIHLHLGTVYMQLWIPGAESEESCARGRRAEAEFKRVLQINPNDPAALTSLTSMSLGDATGLSGDQKIAKLQEAREWNRKLLALQPDNKDAHYWAGVLIWSEFYPALMTTRVLQRMKPEDPGPLPPSPAKSELISKFGAKVEEAIVHLKRALEIDPEFEDAMSYLNLLVRERGDLRDTKQQWKRDVDEGDALVARALETKKKKAQATAPK